jgi:hypothetical protein
MSISHSRFDRLISGMNSTAVKVYEAVPIAGQWSLNQITAEMRRAGINVDSRAVFGCLGVGAGRPGCRERGWQVPARSGESSADQIN